MSAQRSFSLLLVLAALSMAGGLLPLPMVGRMVVAGTIVFVLPGWSALAAWEGEPASPRAVLERLPRAFGVSFTLLTVVTILATTAAVGSLTVTWTYLGLALALVALPPRRSVPGADDEPSPRGLAWAALAGIAVTAAFLWFTGGIYGSVPDGEEALHLALIRKLHSNATIRYDQVMYRPGVVSTYLYLPYHLGVALVARIARVDPLVAYVKLAPLWGSVALASMGALVSALGFGAIPAQVVTLVATVLALNGQAGNWSGPFGRLLPYSHHADLSLGVLLPVALVAVARFVAGGTALHERVTTPALLAAVTVAHTREGVQIAFYLAALAGGLALFRDARRPMLRAFALAAILLTFGLVYARVHQAAVGHIQEWEDAEKERARELWHRFQLEPGLALLGPPLSYLSDRPDYVQNSRSLFHPYFVLGMIVGPVLAIRRANPGRLFLALPMMATILVIGVPLISVAMILATYSQVLFTPARYIFHFCYATIGLAVGTCALVIGRLWAALLSGDEPDSIQLDVTSGGRSVARAIRLPRWLTLAQGAPIAGATGLLAGAVMVAVAAGLGRGAGARPTLALKALLVLHLAALAWFAWRRPRLEAPAVAHAHGPWTAALVGLVVPLALWTQADHPDLGVSARLLPLAAIRAADEPGVTDFEAWYRRQRPLPIPYELLDDIRARIPEPKVFAADPAWMWMLPALANQYVFAYSQYLSTEEPLVMEFARIHGLPLPTGIGEPRLYGLIRMYQTQVVRRFPIFNDEDDAETTALFLRGGGVDYVVAPPHPPAALGRAIDKWPAAFEADFAESGWTVYRVKARELPAPGSER